MNIYEYNRKNDNIPGMTDLSDGVIQITDLGFTFKPSLAFKTLAPDFLIDMDIHISKHGLIFMDKEDPDKYTLIPMQLISGYVGNEYAFEVFSMEGNFHVTFKSPITLDEQGIPVLLPASLYQCENYLKQSIPGWDAHFRDILTGLIAGDFFIGRPEYEYWLEQGVDYIKALHKDSDAPPVALIPDYNFKPWEHFQLEPTGPDIP